MTHIYKLFLLFLMLLAPSLCNCQDRKFQVGIEGGPSLCVFREEMLLFPRKYDDLGLEGMIGVAFSYPIDNNYAFCTGLSWERQGYSNRSGDFHYHFDYLILPVVFQVNLLKKKRFYINMGPYVGYLLSKGFKSDYYDGFFDKWKYEKFDTGITLGLGVNLPIFHHFSTTIGLRNNFGLMNIQKPYTVTRDKYNMGNAGKSFTNSTIILIGISYNLPDKKSTTKPVTE
ncbi:MAG: porin family protein [Bacteroidetes bacterium]|nr:porin family protein [Bacteroidota bacterium]